MAQTNPTPAAAPAKVAPSTTAPLGVSSPEVNILLSDQFVEFSKKIGMIHGEKKTLVEAFKKVYDKFQEERTAFQKTVDDMDRKAAELAADFEKWKKEYLTSATDS